MTYPKKTIKEEEEDEKVAIFFRLMWNSQEMLDDPF
jgi:hypothetical protein